MNANSSYDVIVLGSGIAGLSFANYFLEAQQNLPTSHRLQLLVVSKGEVAQTNTSWAQGGIAAPLHEDDSIEQHIQDTIVAGGFVNDKKITEKIIAQAPLAIQDLIRWGVEFDKNEWGDFDLGLEGGHAFPRILHYQDTTGAAIQKGLINRFYQLGGQVQPNFIAIYIKRTDNGFSILFFDAVTHTYKSINCLHLVLATGGIGQLFEHTTNTKLSNGDGIYFAHQLDADIRDLAFVQFHPTGLYTADGQDFLISEALRGAGATLLNNDHIPFMLNYDTRGDLAPRDIVARAIWEEMKKAKQPFVYLDATHIDTNQLNHHFGYLIEGCLKRTGIDLRTHPIPVMPMQHYSCGGILTNEFGAVTIDNLYAIGECASTGFHGANRLASNSLLEGICVANFAVKHLLANKLDTKPIFKQQMADPPVVYQLDKKEVKKILSNAAGVVRRKSDLASALQELEGIKTKAKQVDFTTQAFENTVTLELSILLLQDAVSKEESIGVHYIEQNS
jgi:L-aspartate oxidase